MTCVNRWILFSLAVGIVVHVVAIDVLGHQPHRSIRTDVVQGIIAGAVLGFITAQIFARIKATRVNGWITIFGCAIPGNGMLFRAACALIFIGPVNVPQ
jgi:NhaP-type Na+/H+ or K+/H+ antiporter